MLLNSLGRSVAIIVGLLMSCNVAAGQFTPGQSAEHDAYRVLNNYLSNTLDDGGRRSATRPVAHSRPVTAGWPVNSVAYDNPTPAQGTRFVPTPTPRPTFGAPIMKQPAAGGAAGNFVGSGVVGKPLGAGGFVGENSVGGAVPPYAPSPIAAGTTGSNAYAAPEFSGYGTGGGFMESCGDECIEIGPSPLATCAGDCCRGCCRFSLGAEYLYWYTKGMRTPELVTTSPLGVGPANAGIKGGPDTTVLFGGGHLDNDGTSGLRVRASVALDCCCCNKIDFEYFYLGDNDFDYSRSTPGDYDILARPYYNPWIGSEDAEFVGYPGVVDGQIDISGSTNFQGYGVWWRHNLLCCGSGQGGCGGGCGGGGYGGPLAAYGGGCGSGCGGSKLTPCRVDVIAGYRRAELDEELYIREFLTTTDPAGVYPAGTTIDRVDQFETQNDFDGFDFGFDWDYCCGKWGINALTKVAFGQVRRRASIRGWTNVTEPGLATQFYDGGLLAAPSNIGHYESSDFTVIPEAGLNLYYQLSCKLRLNFGYSLIFFSDVARAGGLVDLDVDPRQLAPPTVTNAVNPAFVSQTDDFWAQGFNLGLEYCF